MASDIALFLKNKFLESRIEAEPVLANQLAYMFYEIKREFTKDEIFWSTPPPESISCLYDLDHAVAECRVQKPLQKTLKEAFTHRFHDPQSEIKTQLEKIKGDLINIRNKAKSKLISSTAATFPTGRYTDLEGSKLDEILGFDEHENKIVKWLSGDGFNAIGIFGMCGTGKTTLVRKVLNNEKVRNKFKHIIWVCLSDLNEKEVDIRIVHHILDCLGEDTDKFTQNCSNEELVKRLQEKLQSDYPKYLVVLDDVWHCNDWFSKLTTRATYMTQKRFSDALPKHTGGAVIVTSRLKNVTIELVGTEKLVHLKPMNDTNIKALVENSQKDVGMTNLDDVVYHCHGLPLVAGTLSEVISQQFSTSTSED